MYAHCSKPIILFNNVKNDKIKQRDRWREHCPEICAHCQAFACLTCFLLLKELKRLIRWSYSVWACMPIANTVNTQPC